MTNEKKNDYERVGGEIIRVENRNKAKKTEIKFTT